MGRNKISPPETLGEVGRLKWVEITGRLTDFSPMILDQALVYCRAYERWILTQDSLDQSRGLLTQKGEDGSILRVYLDPRLEIVAQMEKQMREASECLRQRMRE